VDYREYTFGKVIEVFYPLEKTLLTKETDTIILHIVASETKTVIKKLIKELLDGCINLVIIDSNMERSNWMVDALKPNKVTVQKNDNEILYACTTLYPLDIPLTDHWHSVNIKKTYIEPYDIPTVHNAAVAAEFPNGISSKYKIYTHTSENSIDFDIPEGNVMWVAGGGLCLESMKEENFNVVFDPILKQCLWIAARVGVSAWKIERLCPGLTKLKVPDYSTQGLDNYYWRYVKWNGVVPDVISVMDLQSLQLNSETVYVSTVEKELWEHLIKDNNIIDVWSNRNNPELLRVE